MNSVICVIFGLQIDGRMMVIMMIVMMRIENNIGNNDIKITVLVICIGMIMLFRKMGNVKENVKNKKTEEKKVRINKRRRKRKIMCWRLSWKQHEDDPN